MGHSRAQPQRRLRHWRDPSDGAWHGPNGGGRCRGVPESRGAGGEVGVHTVDPFHYWRGRPNGDITVRGVGGIRSQRGVVLSLDVGGQRCACVGRAHALLASPEDLTLTLFTLDDAMESMEWESLNMGITSMLEALDHA